MRLEVAIKSSMKLTLLIMSLLGFVLRSSSTAEANPKTVVIYGDSITAGAELTGTDRPHLWVLQVETKSRGKLHTVNEGKGGRPTDSLREFDEMLKRQPKVDLLVIALGGNDARDISGKCVPNALKNLKAMITQARNTYGTKLPILLVGPTNIRKDALGPSKPIANEREANLLALNAAYPELAKTEFCEFVSLYGVLPGAGLTRDGVHPDGAGHDEIVEVMLPAIARAAGVTIADESPAKLPAKTKFHLYLLIGQSNMAGRGELDNDAASPHPRVLKFTKENRWAPAVEPLHFDKPIAGAGLGSSFASAIAEANPDATIGLIPCAVGGTPLSRWVKGGDLYQQAMQRAKLALKDGELKGILWHQGEGDCGDEKLARTYAERLAGMVHSLRTELGAGDVPFVAGKLGGFLAERERKDGKPSFWLIVNKQIDSLPKLAAHCAVVESTGLKDKGDFLHFDTPSLRVFGRRYAEAMRKLQSK